MGADRWRALKDTAIAAFTTTAAPLVPSPAGETNYLGKKSVFGKLPTVIQRRSISIALVPLQVPYLLIIALAASC